MLHVTIILKEKSHHEHLSINLIYSILPTKWKA